MNPFALFAALLVGSWSFAAAPVKPPVAGKKTAVTKAQPAKPNQGVLANKAKPADGQNGRKDDGQQGQYDDGQKNQKDDSQRNQKDDGQQNDRDDGQKNNQDDGQQGQSGNGNNNMLKGNKKQ